MGAKCCTDRKAQLLAPSINAQSLFGATDDYRKPSQSVRYLAPTRGVKPSVMYGVQGPDAEKFDEAMATEDIMKLVALLDSKATANISQVDGMPPHPWACQPATVGALAATQLAVFASEGEVKVAKIRSAGGVLKLAAYLQGATEDQMHASVVALIFISSADAACCRDLGHPETMENLCRILGDSRVVRGCRAGVSTILVNILFESQAAGPLFTREDGPSRMLGALEMGSGTLSEEEPFFLELLENLWELVEAEDQGGAPRFLGALRSAAASLRTPEAIRRLQRTLRHPEAQELSAKLLEQLG